MSLRMRMRIKECKKSRREVQDLLTEVLERKKQTHLLSHRESLKQNPNEIDVSST